MVFGGALVYMFPDLYAMLTHSLGRGTDLTRDEWILERHFSHAPGSLVGDRVGKLLWLGKRIQFLWDKYYFHPNQAHNGYIETYINLGLLGLGAFLVQIIAGYRNVRFSAKS